MDEQEWQVRDRFKEQAKKDGLCEGFHVFMLGGHGTVYVGCGKPAGHDEEDKWHQSQQGKPEGALVVFRWPV
jgi:hypothetical protein